MSWSQKPDYDKTLTDGNSAAAPKAGSYLFEVPGKNASIYISLDVVDRLQQDVMRGFGAVPKRGAEVGGILLGSASQRDRLVVDIEDYEMAVIEYKRGPSFLLSPADLASFETALERLRNLPEADLVPVGFFRSNTRDSIGLVADDLEFLQRFFPDAAAVVLMIKPYATRVGTATVLFREDGKFPVGAPVVEFPFRRKDLAPGDHTVSTRSRPDQPDPALADSPALASKHLRLPRENGQDLAPAALAASEVAESSGSAPEQRKKARRGWVWVPLSFIFLLLGVLLGFQAALTMRPQATSGNSDPFNLQLNISKEGDNLNVRWDRQAPGIRAATKGVLVIVDGAYNKTVELDANQLQTGSVVYRYNSGEVRFRLEVYPRDRDTLIESVNWKQ